MEDWMYNVYCIVYTTIESVRKEGEMMLGKLFCWTDRNLRSRKDELEDE